MVNLGKTGVDRLTGFRGIVTGHCIYISGCNQYLLSPSLGDDGAFREPHWYDEQRIVFEDIPAIVLENGIHPGCDKPAPKR